ncbi:TPA: YafY family transcriptional regulator [Staphylococcus argenteus]|uniref:helix-turn-helix transcriptional regulator n=1 Tax=Staphylococcus argenteus TaxID=985002 RepID=UPI000B597FD2|nr:YafY family protein [Staphylococcus argenteus]HDY9542983.1 YafY family transcriptional regulator [Staphylococcus argenteus]HDY9544657.1 YafY family transcriptional regulator [Staphylococcus argenteus]HDY9575093.1 YafY family transcriptional regulator [Staphylococcus argenteus]HDY9577500.1 YafY family transcriptional regulator [Staphylococcus argenteus]HDY9581258.1 YafY family transcriptional regulator [Staphylococcus argenteus]
MNKAERQNLIITAIQQNNKMTALELAKYCNVSKRTILRDIDDLENQGVKIYAHYGKNGGYQIQQAQSKISLNLSESQLSALFLVLNESQSYSTLPYKSEINAIIKQCLNLPQTRLRKLLKRMDFYIKFEDTQHMTLSMLFSDILIYCTERNVMLVDYKVDDKIKAENVIFIGLLCKSGHWHAVIYDIATDMTAELEIANIVDISYSFGKTIQTRDISIDNYHQFLNPIDS